MTKTVKRQWSYLAMLGISIFLFFFGWKLDMIHLEAPAAGTQAEFRDGYRELRVLEWLKDFFHFPDSTPDSPIRENPSPVKATDEAAKTEEGGESHPEETVNKAADNEEIMTSVSENETAPRENIQAEMSDRRMGAAQPFQADSSYFDDALFIGDSRTVGLLEYGDLGQAEVLADSGMSVYKIMKTAFPLKNGEKVYLEELLANRSFGKIYIMLGINELGYDFDQTVKRYQELVDMICAAQPGAIVFLEANLHITQEKSGQSPHYNNENINRFNYAVSEMADGERIFYLDVNPLFDDERGALNPELTTDHTHILGKYYASWVDWILTQAR
ncbi:MAG: GDSL-type esterase/lipase family protein [Lachnospiraceae bacterium]